MLRGCGIWCERIENGLAAGTPDVHYVAGGVGGWIELKHCDRAPVRAATVVFGEQHGLRKEQKAWLLDYEYHGGTAFIIAGVGAIMHVMRADPWAVRNFNSMTMVDLAASSLKGRIWELKTFQRRQTSSKASSKSVLAAGN